MNELYKRIEANFKKQGLMKTLNASLDKVESGLVQISSTFGPALSQQHNFFHAGVMTSIADSACGYAAMTLVGPEKDILSVEFKINLMRPGNTGRLIAVGKVVQSGKTLTMCEGYVYDETGEKLLAKMSATMMTVDANAN